MKKSSRTAVFSSQSLRITLKLSSLLICFLCSNGPAIAQIPSLLYTDKIDSLQTQLRYVQGTKRVDVLNGLAQYLAPRYFDSSLNYANAAWHLAGFLGYQKGLGLALFNKGNSHFFHIDARNALINYYDALRILESLGPSEDLGNLYFQLACYSDPANNLRKALQVFRTIGDKTAEHFILLKIPPATGHDSTIILGKQNLDYFRKINNPEGVYQTLYDLANACFYLRKPEGLAYAEAALKMAEATGDPWLIANSYHKVLNYHKNVFKVPEFKTDEKLAESYLLRARKILLTSNIPYRHRLLGETYRELGELKESAGDYKMAIRYYGTGIATIDTFFRRFDTLLFPEPDLRLYHYYMERGDMLYTYLHLKELYYRIGDYKKAYDYWIKGDSITQVREPNVTNQQIIVMQANYEDGKKRQQIALLTKENEIRRLTQTRALVLFGGIGGTALICFLIILLFLQRKRFRSEHKAVVLEQKLLRSQMNPHFIFNSLSSIQNYIVTERPDKASIYLSKFSRLVRNILDNSEEEYVALEKEVSTIENYLELQKIRYAGKFDYRIRIAEEIDADTLMIPPMLAQPFIENAIEHGIKYKQTPGHIDIRFSLTDDMLLFTVEDDGVGRKRAREIESRQEGYHRSLATSITTDRLKVMKIRRGTKISLDIKDLKDEAGQALGTRISFKIPVLTPKKK